MKSYKTVNGLRRSIASLKAQGRRIAFIPTMGALHEGHISLVRMAVQDGCEAVVSIFVNPSQFNNQEDLAHYPRMPEKDSQLLVRAGCSLLFMPSVEEVYPPGLDVSLHIYLEGKDQVMEGVFRPGHFKGMLEVVKRLLDIVEPDFLYMGQKDFQQYSLVAHMLRVLNLSPVLRIGETLREPDGLAMSSRNLRLTPEFRQKAPVIFRALNHARAQLPLIPVSKIQEECLSMIAAEGLKPEYFELVDGNSLTAVSDPARHPNVVACVACWAGAVRLIDNLVLKP